MRKIAAILLSLALSLSLLCPAWATDGAPVLKIEEGNGDVWLMLDGLGDLLVYSIQLELTTSGTGSVSFVPAAGGSEGYYGTYKANGNKITIYIDSLQSLNDYGTASLGTLRLGGNTVGNDATLTLLGPNLEPYPNVTRHNIEVETVPKGTISGPAAPTNPTVPAGPVISFAPGANVQGGGGSATITEAMGDELVKQAVDSNSENIVIAPGMTGDVTKAEVSIPASTVGKIGSETNASLTVSTPVADVTIPNGGLGSLSSAGGTVKVTAEKAGDTVKLTVTAGGKAVESIPGGVLLTVPVADAAPGTVAVLIHEDGTREVVRKSVAVDGRITIPLDGSAKLQIVDNSKYFADVPAASWAADAVAFASSHELFNGTAPDQFSPEEHMSRGMLAVVLHNMENNPEQDADKVFTDVGDTAWYAKGVAWAASTGVVNGYGDGRFGPNDNITREQLAVMLWRYAGSPNTANTQLNFDDAGKTSDWALEALLWATGNGIINGKGGGILDPTGLATRAEAAQMLKNFMENQ